MRSKGEERRLTGCSFRPVPALGGIRKRVLIHMGMCEKSVITVQIFGKEYPIASDQNREYIEKLANYVDTKMNQISAGGDALALGKIAVQACLNVADDLMRVKNEKEQLIRTIQGRISSIAKMIEDRLENRSVCSEVKESHNG